MAQPGFQVQLKHPQRGSQSFEIGARRVTVGRLNSGAEIEIDDPLVSKRHGSLWADEQGAWYEDNGSTNGSWVGERRIEGPLRLKSDLQVKVGNFNLQLAEKTLELPPGLELSLVGQVGGHGLTKILGQSSDAVYLSAIYSLTEGLLRSDSLEFIPEALNRARKAVAVPVQMAVVAWPPESDGSLRFLCGQRAGVSTSLARYAVEQGRALLLTGALPEAVANAPSIRMRSILGAVYVPLQGGADEEILGLLCVDSPLPLKEVDFQFLCAVAGLLAGKLSSERLRQEANRQALEKQQQQSRREALASFLQIASHDLKNPLTAIENCGRLLRRLPPERHAQIIDILLGASARATDLIRTYLDAAAVDGGKPLEVQWEDVDVTLLVDQETQFLRAALRDRMDKIQVVNQVQGPPLRADSRKLRQVFCNLISNAIKYSPNGGQVTIKREGTRFSVSDQGVGIAPEHMPKLFAAFERVGDRSIASGTGLGLWLTAALIHAHGGEIGVDSTAGEGSTFWFTLPGL
ncbi:FHA domain-containing protein [bacterium]|nr:FHA domain-containing protein [bacterium]